MTQDQHIEPFQLAEVFSSKPQRLWKFNCVRTAAGSQQECGYPAGTLAQPVIASQATWGAADVPLGAAAAGHTGSSLGLAPDGLQRPWLSMH